MRAADAENALRRMWRVLRQRSEATPDPAIHATAVRLYVELLEGRSAWRHSQFFHGCPEGLTQLSELCNELRRLGAVDQIVVEITFDTLDDYVYVKTASGGQLHLL